MLLLLLLLHHKIVRVVAYQAFRWWGLSVTSVYHTDTERLLRRPFFMGGSFEGTTLLHVRCFLQKSIAENDLVEFTKHIANKSNGENVPSDRFNL